MSDVLDRLDAVITERGLASGKQGGHGGGFGVAQAQDCGLGAHEAGCGLQADPA